MPVPKKIHIVWVGDESRRPELCIDSWRRLNPDYEVFVWGNSELVNNRWVNARHIRQMMTRELAGVADLMRYEILYSEGGIALDADALCIRPLEDWVIEPDDFTCWSNEIYLGQLLANGVMGAKPQSAYIEALISAIYTKETVVDDRAWVTTGPMMTTGAWKALQYPLTIWPSHMFLPDFHSGRDYEGKGPVFARQFYGSTQGGLDGVNAAYDAINAKVAKIEGSRDTSCG